MRFIIIAIVALAFGMGTVACDKKTDATKTGATSTSTATATAATPTKS